LQILPQSKIAKIFKGKIMGLAKLRSVAGVFVIAALPMWGNAQSQVEQNPVRREPITPVPDSLPHDPAKAMVGRAIFFEKKLSGNSSMSCATCHLPSKGGADGLDNSMGASGKQTAVNTPTVLNAALNFRQFWDGRARSLHEQADMLITRGASMGSNWADTIARLSSDPALKKGFEKAYPGQGLSRETVMDSLEQYQRTLLTPNSRFDQYLKGKSDALSARELRGYALFKSYGCVACHQGVNVGGNMYQKFGAVGDYFKDRGQLTQADLGRYNVTKNEADKNVFRVAPLRNVALTAPYFHDGSAKDLAAAVEVMFKYQLGRTAPKQDKDDIVSFLQSLTGEIPKNFTP
jgi:cytochrome c peroxidase